MVKMACAAGLLASSATNNTSSSKKVFIRNTKYFPNRKPIDINPLELQLYKSFLVVCAREGQVIRLTPLVEKLVEENVVDSCSYVLGWWKLGYLFKDNPNSNQAFREYFSTKKHIFFMDPERVWEPVRKDYSTLIRIAQQELER